MKALFALFGVENRFGETDCSGMNKPGSRFLKSNRSRMDLDFAMNYTSNTTNVVLLGFIRI